MPRRIERFGPGSETRQALAGARPNRGAQGGFGRSRWLAQLPGRSHRWMAVHGADANRSRDRTRLTGRPPGTTANSSVLVLAPDRSCRAGIADRSGLVHGAEGEGMVVAPQQAVDLH